MRISHLSAECSPFAKTGGLGDVVGALPKALACRGHDVDIWIPFHLEAAQWYRRAADLGNQAAMYNLGTMYQQGLGVLQDAEEARKWFAKASLNGLGDPAR